MNGFILLQLILTWDLFSMLWLEAVASFSLYFFGVSIFLERKASLVSDASGLSAGR